MSNTFNTNLRDAQGTFASRVRVQDFNFSRYQEYEQRCSIKTEQFFSGNKQLLVYRRMRGDGIFYDACKNFKDSLEIQLGVLQKSMGYKADIANFLEPWYGIGYIASCFGGNYIWTPNQAPAVEPLFSSVSELLQADYVPIHKSPIGQEILHMIEYFLDQTQGKLPVSFSDVQAPVNMLSYLVPMSALCMEVYDNIDHVKQAAKLVNSLLVEFLEIQRDLIGDCLVKPGHGFASSRKFEGVGESADNVIMFSSEHYTEIFQPCHEILGKAFGGTAFHSCGSWQHKLDMVKGFKRIICVDAAFSPQTDPDPSDPAVFIKTLQGSHVILNARCVGGYDDIIPYFEKLVGHGVKVIATTYCSTPEVQKRVYNRLHKLIK